MDLLGTTRYNLLSCFKSFKTLSPTHLTIIDFEFLIEIEQCKMIVAACFNHNFGPIWQILGIISRLYKYYEEKKKSE